MLQITAGCSATNTLLLSRECSLEDEHSNELATTPIHLKHFRHFDWILEIMRNLFVSVRGVFLDKKKIRERRILRKKKLISFSILKIIEISF